MLKIPSRFPISKITIVSNILKLKNWLTLKSCFYFTLGTERSTHIFVLWVNHYLPLSRLHQWFSVKDNGAPQGTSCNAWRCHSFGDGSATGIQWVKGTDTAKHRTMRKIAKSCTTKNYSAKNVRFANQESMGYRNTSANSSPPPFSHLFWTIGIKNNQG